MATVTMSDREHYQICLGIIVDSHPLTPYQLLGISELESNWVKIRTAIDRQRAVLESARAEVPQEAWQTIFQELEQAIITLNDSSAKAVLDATIRRRRAKLQPIAVAVGPPPTLPAGTAIACRHCQKSNQGTRRFCASCGQSLWDRCPKCQLEITVEERFCGHCGTDVGGELQQQQRQLAAKLKFAQQQAADLKYEDAITTLRSVAALEDLKFDAIAERALELIEEYQKAAQRSAGDVKSLFAKAKAYYEHHSFERAIAKLDDIPPLLRTAEMNELRQSALAARNEILSLSGDIREAVAAKKTSHLLPKLERLLTLKPNNPGARQLAEQVRNGLVARAQKLLQKHEYRLTLDTLQKILPFVRTEEIERFQAKIEEVNALVDLVRSATVADPTTIKFAKRLAKSLPTDPQLQTWLNELKTRAAQPLTSPRQVLQDYGPPSANRALGVPFDLLGSFTRLTSSDAAVNETVRKHPGQFWVALGLALQGIEQAAIDFNLAVNEKTPNMLGRFSLSFKKKLKPAWGLDLSPIGLKAIKLGVDEKTSAVSLLAAEFIPHGRILSHPDAEVDRNDLIKQTLQTFLSRHKLEGERLVAGLSGERVLGRFFQMPPMPAKKIAEAIAFEAKHQFPIALEDLHWGKHLFGKDGPDSESQPRAVLVAAARDFHVKERLRPFQTNGLNIEILAAEPIALHNALTFEFFGDEAATEAKSENHKADKDNKASKGDKPANGKRLTAIAAVDVGTESTNVVISSPDFCWFRSIATGGDDFTQSLVKQFQLTYDQAEQLKQSPGEVKSLRSYLEAVQPLCVQLRGEIVRSLETQSKMANALEVSRVYGIGGGSSLFGLLRELRG